MPNLRDLINAAVARGAIGRFSGGISVRDVASKVGEALPLSIRRLITKLDSLPAPTPPPPPPPPIPTPQPTISVSFSGSMTAAQFAVTGRDFLKNLPGTQTSSVAIRVVDANVGIETRHEFVSSDSLGRINHVVTGDISGLVVNALGIATIAFSATDGRIDPTSPSGQFIWSNTVRINFP